MSLRHPGSRVLDLALRRCALSAMLRACLLTFAACAFLIPPAAAVDPPVTVVVDMDAAEPGLQPRVTVLPGTSAVEDIAVYAVDPLGRPAWGMGYLGGIDRGIAFGHMPDRQNAGTVVALEAAAVAPANPGNTAVIVAPPGMDPGFAGAEVQYVEGGATSAAPLPSSAVTPLFTVDVLLDQTQDGDIFDFYLLDFVVVWSGGTAGAFSTVGHLSLDSGGDVVPDHTVSIHGVDPDVPLPVPPATFAVDYVDGGDSPGPATIVVRAATALAAHPAQVLTVLHQNVPNPCTAATTIAYELAEPGPVQLAVYDVQGRLVRALVRDGARPAGRHAARWTGRDQQGARVPAGAYFVRLVAGKGEQATFTRRVILAR